MSKRAYLRVLWMSAAVAPIPLMASPAEAELQSSQVNPADATVQPQPNTAPASVPPAPAQETSTEEPEPLFGEEIVVTAQRRREFLQEVPFSISAVTGEQLEELGAEGFETFANRVPGLQLTRGTSGSTQLNMRGVTSTPDVATNPQMSTTVGLYLDDVQIGLAAVNPDFALYDLERIEVLRGPQGTLYGAGSVSGALRLITRKPHLSAFQYGGGVEVSSTRGGDSGWRGDAVVNLPISEDRLALRVLGFYRLDGGYIDNIHLNKKNTSDHRSYGGRAAFGAKIGERLDLVAKGMFQQDHFDDEEVWDAFLPFPQRRTDVLEPVTNRSQVYDLSLDYDVGLGTVTSVTSYQRRYSFQAPEVSRFALFIGGRPGQFTGVVLPSTTKADAWAQEIRLASDSDKAFKYIVGAYYSRLNRDFFQSLDIPGIEAVGRIPPGSTFGLPTDRVFQGAINPITTQTALFVDATYDITDSLSASAGVRGYRYVQKNDLFFTGVLNAGTTKFNETARDKGFNPRFNLSYEASPDKLIYMQASRGFRIGGVNNPVPAVGCESSLIELGLDAPPTSFGSESLWNYEVGAKTDWARGRFRLNVAAFRIDYNDIQLARRLTCGFGIIQNAGRVQVNGLEVETVVRPAKNLTFTFGAALTDSRLQETLKGIGNEGDKSPFVPDLAVSAGADYQIPLRGGWDLSLSSDIQMVEERKTAFRTGSLDLPSYVLASARFGVENDRFRINLFVNNITDERAIYRQFLYAFSRRPRLTTTTARPRTVGLAARIKL